MKAATSMRLLTGALALCLAGPAAAAFPPPLQSKDDGVTLKGNAKSETGKIVDESYDGLDLEIKKGVKKHILWSQIASVAYAGRPVEFTEALDIQNSDPQAALDKFETFVGTDGADNVVRQQAMYEVAMLQQRLGALDKAAAAWNALIAAYPEGRYLGAAARGVTDCLLIQGDAAGASKALDTLAASPAAGKFEALGLQLKALRGTILMAQGKFADARTAFEQVEKDPKAAGDVAAAATLGAAESLRQEGKLPEAEARFKAIVAGDGPNFLLAGAWNGLGDMLSEKGMKARSADVVIEALYAYLRGVVQYVPAPGESQDEYERALGGAAKCFKALSQLESNKERKAYYESQYSQEAKLLRQLAPNSEYLKQL